MNILDKAILFAVKAHEGQTRKLSEIPYILHPLEVAGIIATMTDNIDTMAAGVLHDTIEDCGTLPEEIEAEFGAKILALVQSETEDKMPEKPAEESWKQRKENSLLILRESSDIQVKIIWLADKLSNIRSFYREYRKSGNAFWQSLNQKDSKMQEWYYRTVLENVSELSRTAAYEEFSDLIDKLFGGK